MHFFISLVRTRPWMNLAFLPLTIPFILLVILSVFNKFNWQSFFHSTLYKFPVRTHSEGTDTSERPCQRETSSWRKAEELRRAWRSGGPVCFTVPRLTSTTVSGREDWINFWAERFTSPFELRTIPLGWQMNQPCYIWEINCIFCVMDWMIN